MKRTLFLILFLVLGSIALSYADTIKHRFHSPVTDSGDPNEVGPDEWNDSLIMDGGTTGNIPMRDPTQADGWRWVTPAPVSTSVPAPTATPIPAAPTTYTPQNVTCTSTGDGSLGALTITPSSAVIAVTNSDPDGCDITLSESGAVAGRLIMLVVVSNAGGTVNIADTPGVTETSSAFNMDLTDSISFVYVNSAWHELSRSNN